MHNGRAHALMRALRCSSVAITVRPELQKRDGDDDATRDAAADDDHEGDDDDVGASPRRSHI